jgi:hypothetical protein
MHWGRMTIWDLVVQHPARVLEAMRRHCRI